MFSIEKNIESCITYSKVYYHNKHLCFIICISSGKSKNEITNYYNLVCTLSKLINVVLVIDPRVDYKTVEAFQINNVHILRLSLNNNLTRNSFPFYLLDKEGKILSVKTNKISDDLIKRINLDLYIPNFVQEYDLPVDSFNYDIYYDTALITLKDKKYEKKIKDIFYRILKLKQTIVLYSNRKFFARFINKKTVIVNASIKDNLYTDNIKKLSKYKTIIFDLEDDILSNYLLIDKSILVDSILFNKNRSVLSKIQNEFGKSILFVDFKDKTKDDLSDIIISIPYSSSHNFFEQNIKTEKRFKERKLQ